MSDAGRMGLMWHGDEQERRTADLDSSRFAGAADALRQVGITPQAVIYNDDFAEDVRARLLKLDAVQVWVNPIAEGKNRTILDALLCEAAEAGILVTTHPDTIMKMGTKQVLVDTKTASFGSDAVAYRSVQEMRKQLPARLVKGARVLKQFRGHSGGGIWKFSVPEGTSSVDDDTLILLRHAERGAIEESVTFEVALKRMQPYFEASGLMIDQPYQERLAEGITRIYMVEEEVAGFGHQAINALYPASSQAPSEPPPPGPRLYYPPDQPEFNDLRRRMETSWLGELKKLLGLTTDELPLLWDADFLLGPNGEGMDSYVLCEVNVSCVSPYPQWANEKLAQVALKRLQKRKIGVSV